MISYRKWTLSRFPILSLIPLPFLLSFYLVPPFRLNPHLLFIGFSPCPRVGVSLDVSWDESCHSIICPHFAPLSATLTPPHPVLVRAHETNDLVLCPFLGSQRLRPKGAPHCPILVLTNSHVFCTSLYLLLWVVPIRVTQMSSFGL